MTLRIIILTIIAVVANLHAAADDNASRLLDKVVEWLGEKKTIEIDYTLTSGDQTASGKLVSDGNRFRVMSEVMDTWYDGKTQWTYSPNTGEVTVTEPADEEIQQVNPFAIIEAFRRNYTVGLKPLTSGSTHHVIVMTPNDPSGDISRVEISVPVGYFYPARIAMWTASGEALVINTVRLIRGNRYDASEFTYSPSVHPDAEIVDLR